MAATKTVAQPAALRKSVANATQLQAITNHGPTVIKPRRGVVTLFGYGVSIRVERGHLILEDGIGSDRFQGRFPRVGHGIERIVAIGNDGSVSLAALRWLADQKAAFVMLERDGSVLLTTGQLRSSDARLRRAQARANDTGAALQIARVLIDEKLRNQESLVRHKLGNSTVADAITKTRADLTSASTVEVVRSLEAQGAMAYWSAWQGVPITFPHRELPRVPEHWRTFGGRRSPLTGSPRLAVNPANAMLNYLYALIESEARLAAAAMGLDSGIGFLHMDHPSRDSLACDLMEPVRPQVDDFVLEWISREALKREWFFEQRDGNCRLMAPFAAKLSENAQMLRRAVAPFAEMIAQTLWDSLEKSGGRKLGPATRLTQTRNREAKGRASQAAQNLVRPGSFCRICGVSISPGGLYCSPCNLTVASDQMKTIAPSGWVATQGPRAQALRAETQRGHEAAKRAWDPAKHPAWLDGATYRKNIQPRLLDISTSAISTALGVTWGYAWDVRRGRKIPHARHWVTLAKLVKIDDEPIA